MKIKSHIHPIYSLRIGCIVISPAPLERYSIYLVLILYGDPYVCTLAPLSLDPFVCTVKMVLGPPFKIKFLIVLKFTIRDAL